MWQRPDLQYPSAVFLIVFHPVLISVVIFHLVVAVLSPERGCVIPAFPGSLARALDGACLGESWIRTFPRAFLALGPRMANRAVERRRRRGSEIEGRGPLRDGAGQGGRGRKEEGQPG